MDWESGISRCKPGWKNNKVLLYSTGNYIQSPGINHYRKEYLLKKECLYVYYRVTLLYSRDRHNTVHQLYLSLDRGRTGKESARQCRRCRFESCVGKMPWSGARQPTPVFPSGESHGQEGRKVEVHKKYIIRRFPSKSVKSIWRDQTGEWLYV